MQPSSMLPVSCGPFAVQWSASDRQLSAYLVRRWRPWASSRPPDVDVRLVPMDDVDARATATPRQRSIHSDDTHHLTMRIGDLACVCWQQGTHRLVCTYAARSMEAFGVLLAEGLAGWLLLPWLCARGSALFHAAGIIAADGSVDVFMGPSGIGKTTLTRLADPPRVVHDDMLILTPDARGWWQVNAPPWRHTSAAGAQAHRLGRLFVLTRERPSGAVALSPAEAVPALWRAISHGMQGAWLWQERWRIAHALLEQRRCYRLRYRLEEEDPWSMIAATARDTA